MRAHFSTILEQEFTDIFPLSSDATWEGFRQNFLVPLVESFGARTYEIVTGSRTVLEQAPFALNYLSSYEAHLRPHVRRLIETFFDPSFVDFRSYTLRLLNCHFFYIANQYRREHLEALYGGHKKPKIRCMLDTNFLYSILELHDNPSNDAAKALLETIQSAKKYIEVRLYVFPPTVDELKKSLAIHEHHLSEMRVTPNMSEAVSSDAVSGVALKFFKECSKANYSLSAKDYFDPYQKNLAQILADKGILLFNEPTDRYSTDQRVIDDALDQKSFLQQRNLIKKVRGRTKTYEQIWHDVLLWYFIFDKRPQQVESVIDADVLGITIDYSLIGFDSFKRREMDASIPVFIHPASLIQLFQFFVPLDDKFEAAIVETLRLPFLLQEFDPESEKTTVRILTRLSRFENIKDLTPDTIRHVLENELLRDKLERVEGADEEVALIREALIEENAKVQRELEEAKRREDDFIKRISTLEGLTEEDKARISSLRQEVTSKEDVNEELKGRFDALEKNLRASRIRAREETIVSLFTAYFVRWPLVGYGLLLMGLSQSFDWSRSDVIIASLPICSVFVGWLYLVCWLGRTRFHMAHVAWFRVVNKIKIAVGGLVLSVWVGVAAAMYWNVISSYLGLSGPQ